MSIENNGAYEVAIKDVEEMIIYANDDFYNNLCPEDKDKKYELYDLVAKYGLQFVLRKWRETLFKYGDEVLVKWENGTQRAIYLEECADEYWLCNIILFNGVPKVCPKNILIKTGKHYDEQYCTDLTYKRFVGGDE